MHLDYFVLCLSFVTFPLRPEEEDYNRQKNREEAGGLKKQTLTF